MRLFAWLVALFVAASSVVLAHDDVVLPPLQGKVGPPSVLLFAQGASIKTSQYVSLVQKIQQAVPFPLWVGIPQCFEDNCAVPLTLSDGMKRVRLAMEKQGLVAAKKTFHAGHSLGGAMLPDYVKSLLDKDRTSSDGLVLLGAYLTRVMKTGKTAEGRPQVEFPTPTLTIGAELDGLCRLSRIAEALYSQVTFSADPEGAVKSLPVTVVEGMNHMLFASGEAPKFVADNDLHAEISEDEAHSRVASDVSQFFIALESGDKAEAAWRNLGNRVGESTKFVQPIVDALLMEGYFQFLPPCYCETNDEYGSPQHGTCVSQPSCNGGTPWTGLYAQPIMGGGGKDGLKIEATDSIHIVTEEKPSCHLPHIHQSQYKHNDPNWANPGSAEETNPDLMFPPLCEKGPGAGCTLTLTTVTEPYYENSGEFDIWRIHFGVDKFDTGYLPISATELKTKLKSRQAVWEAAGVQNVSRTNTDITVGEGGVSDRCREINDAAINWAKATVGAKTLERYNKYGQQLVSAPDAYAVCPGGPCWIWDPLRFKKDDEQNTAAITAVAFSEPNTNPFPCGEGKALPCPAGMHYCMLFSPARAVEWMYVDGLRNKYSYKSAPASAAAVKEADPAASFTFTKLGEVKLANPAFISFIKGDLFVTQFAETGAGNVVKLPDVGKLFGADSSSAAIAAAKFSAVGSGYTWPNMIELIPEGVFSQDEKEVLCATTSSASCDLYVVPDGFLTPFHKTGGIYIQPSSAPATKFAVAKQENDWFYHQAHFVDVDLDGLVDVVAARTHVNAIGASKGELVWFKHPDNVKEEWPMTKLTDGPDVITLLKADVASSTLLVFSAEFFSSKLAVTSFLLTKGKAPQVQCTAVIDNIKAEDVQFIDLNNDGAVELVANSHEGGAGGSIVSYVMPPAGTSSDKYCSYSWAAGKTIVGAGFKVEKMGLNQAAPGFFYPVAAGGKTYLVVAGDGSEAVHLVAPTETSNVYSTSKVIPIGGTVGTVAVADIDEDGVFDLVVPDYDHGVLSFYAMKPN